MVARPPRIEIAGAIYHVVARGNERRLIFRDDNDHAVFLEMLGKTLDRYNWELLAYCLMSNHYHLLVRPAGPNLSRGMHYLNACYAQHFNRRHNRVGHLFQGRFKAVLVQGDSHLLAAIRYIVRNPVRAGLCVSPAEWRWSSHQSTAGMKPPGRLSTTRVLELFHDDPTRARELYRDFTENAVDSTDVQPHTLIAGDSGFIEHHLSLIEPSTEHTRRDLYPSPTPLEDLISVEPTNDEIANAYARGHSLSAIATHLGLNKSTISRRLRRRNATIQT
jgi:putative transposase